MNAEEQIRQEVERQLREKDLPESSGLAFQREGAAFLGSGIGAGAGLLAVTPIERLKTKMAYREHNKMIDRMSIEKKSLSALYEIHTGKIGWDEIDEQARPILQSMYEDPKNQELLNNPQAVREKLNVRIPARIAEMPMDFKRKVQLNFPIKELINDTGSFKGHPAVPIGSLAGMAGGYALANHVIEKNKEK